jgi:hypothetical protein
MSNQKPTVSITFNGWEGRITGPERNREMVEAGADLCIALHRSIETSKGTSDCVRQVLAAGISVWLVEDERAIPRRTRADDETWKSPSEPRPS